MDFLDNISAIVNDRSHGSSHLLDTLIQAFLKYEPTTAELLQAMDLLEKIAPSMRVLHHFIEFLDQHKNAFDISVQVKNYQQKWSATYRSIANNLEKKIKPQVSHILTHSHSGVIISTLRHLYKKGEIHVYQTESEPGKEGRLQADSLSKSGIPVTVLPDAQIENYVASSHLILLGVDHFTDHHFVNKTGSGNICNLARQYNKKVYVLGDSRKKTYEEFAPGKIFERVAFEPNITLIHE